MDAAVRDLLAARLPADAFRCSETGPQRLTVELGPEHLREAAELLLGGERARFVTLTAVDDGLEVSLQYTFALGRTLVTVRTQVPKEASRIPSLADVVPASEMIEREVSELFGVEFPGNPREARLMLPEGEPAGPPLRKPLSGPILPQARLSLEHLLRGGASLRVAPAAAARREALGLPAQPPIASAAPETLAEFQELVRRTAADRRAGYDWAKGRLRYK